QAEVRELQRVRSADRASPGVLTTEVKLALATQRNRILGNLTTASALEPRPAHTLAFVRRGRRPPRCRGTRRRAPVYRVPVRGWGGHRLPASRARALT